MKLKETQIISFANLKGGVGKTTITANTGASLARQGYKVLLIDWDPQGNLTSFYGLHNQENLILNHQALTVKKEEYVDPDKLHPYSVPQYPENLFVLPTDLELAALEGTFGSKVGSEFIMENLVEKFIDDFDFILIDTNPALTTLTLNALYASDHVVIVVQTGQFSESGLEKVLKVRERTKKIYKEYLFDVLGCVFSLVNPNLVITKDYFRDYKERDDVYTFDSVIRQYAPLSESGDKGLHMDIFSYNEYMNEGEADPKPINGVEDIYNFSNEILYKLGEIKEFSFAREDDQRQKEQAKKDPEDVVKKSLVKKKGDLKAGFKEFLDNN